MKAYLAIILGLLFLPATVAMAAYNDVSLNTGGQTMLTVNGISLKVDGQTASIQSITVDSSNFSFVLLPGSAIRVTSADRKVLSHDATSGFVTSTLCSGTESSVGFSFPTSLEGTSLTVTVTPSTSTCVSGGGGNTGGGGASSSSSSAGGGGGGGAAAVATTQVAAVSQAPAVSTPSVSAVFVGNLKKGASSSDIKRLQQLLNSDPDTKIAESGAGSPGNESDYFGSLTVAAVQKFQSKYGIVSSGTPATTGYGSVGPATRAKLNELFGAGTPPASAQTQSTPATSVSPALSGALFEKGLGKGTSSSDVKALQQILNSDPDTKIAESGAGSPGNETNLYGSLTEKAVRKFQEKHGIASPGDPGYGFVGPKTRAKLNEMSGSSSGSSSSSQSSGTSGGNEAALNAALQAQIDALNAQLKEMLSQVGN